MLFPSQIRTEKPPGGVTSVRPRAYKPWWAWRARLGHMTRGGVCSQLVSKHTMLNACTLWESADTSDEFNLFFYKWWPHNNFYNWQGVLKSTDAMISTCDESHVGDQNETYLDDYGPFGKVKGMEHLGICRSVASVISAESSSARISLPGVMDTEGRVDESRLRMHVFKNGNFGMVVLNWRIEHYFLHAKSPKGMLKSYFRCYGLKHG